jgi:hypothetical protein
VSRQSQAKKARRRKRQAAREVSWIPESVIEDTVAAGSVAGGIGEAVAAIDDWITDRGWVLDAENADDVVSWVYPPSAASFDDEDREPVTRVWITLVEDDDEVVLEFGAAVVGAGADDSVYVLDPDGLAEDLAVLEAYRPGLPRPEFT